jgi:retron-type reverse transcriptase
MSPGTDGLLIDGTSFHKLQALRDTVLDSESPYEWGGGKRISKPDKRKKINSFGLPCFQDRIVQGVLRMLLEPIYESVFSRRSHGWRSGRSAHTALRSIRSDFKITNWIVLGNINKLFDTVNDGVLCHLMRRKIRDKKLLKLISGGLKAKMHMPYGNIEDSNLLTPEGRILSAILSNIYLHGFDIWIEERIQQYNLERKDNRGWVLLQSQGKMRKARPRSDPFDPLYRKMEYRRYGDYFLIAVRGALSDAKGIRQECETFLGDKLKLLLNIKKTQIKHISVGIPFLGHRIGRRVVRTKQRYQTEEGWRWGRKKEVLLTMDADMNQLKLRLQQQAYLAANGDPSPNFGLMKLPRSEANRRMNSILRGYANWFQFAGNKRSAIAYLAYVLRSSLAKMFAAKFKLHSVRKVFQITGNNLGRVLETRYPVGVTDSQVEAWRPSVSGKGTPREIPGFWRISQPNRVRGRLLRHTKKR